MSYQRSKAPLSLMEQLIMIFVFAFAAAICLQAFVYSDKLSRDVTTRETASMRAMEVVEVTKAYRGDLAKVAEKLSGSVVPAGEDGQKSLIKEYTEDGLKVELKVESGTDDLVEKGRACVYEITEEASTEEVPVYAVDVAWQTKEQS